MHPKTKIRIKQLLFTFVAIVGALLILEGITRVLNLPAKPLGKYGKMSDDEFVEDHPQIFWKMRPNVHIVQETFEFTTNSLGLRDDEIAIPKPKNTFRVLCLGESTTFGASVPQNGTYAQVAEQTLNTEGGPIHYDVINGGFSASSSFQALQWTKIYGDQLEPDVVVLYYLGNDLMPSFVRANFLFSRGFDLTDRQLFELRNRSSGWLYFFEHSMLYKTIKHLIVGRMRHDAELRHSQWVDKNSAARPEWPSRVPNDDRNYVLGEFLKWCNDRGIRLLVMFPCYITSTMDPVYQDDLLFRWTRSHNVPMLDCVPLLHNAGISWDVLFKKEIDTHPSPEAHAVMGKALAQFILANKQGAQYHPPTTP